nr:lrr receptor-like serine/threonine-protein kinase gso1 [Quercus suber]
MCHPDFPLVGVNHDWKNRRRQFAWAAGTATVEVVNPQAPIELPRGVDGGGASATKKYCLCSPTRHPGALCYERILLLLPLAAEFLSFVFSCKLFSWVGEDCCQWKGVECDNESGHVTKLNLSNPAGRRRHYEYDGSDKYLSSCSTGRLSSYSKRGVEPSFGYSSRNTYEYDRGSFRSRLLLGDVNASFSGKISPYLGNLSSLTHLDLEGNYMLSTKNLDWVSSLSSLKYLYLGGVKINHTKADWLNAINMLPSLLELSLCSCELEHLPSSLTSLNFTSLNVLDLSYNLFNTSIPQWLFSLTSLTKLDLSFSNLGGKFLDSFGRIGSLKYLYLGGNHFYGSIPASIGNLSSLKELDLSYNEMNGTILESFGQLSNLVKLYLLENSWEGVITEAQLMNLKMLEEFMLTTDKNQSLVFNVTYNWFPPFSLKSLHLESCLIGPKFPFWLQDQSKLFSWVGEDCCQWKGVECDNESGHVTKLNLSNPAGRRRHYEYDGSDKYLSSCSTGRLSSYSKRDVEPSFGYSSRNTYEYDRGSFRSRLLLGDVNASFSGKISPYLGNLSSLTHLDLEGNYMLSTKNLDWVSSLSSLKYLYLGGVKINHTKADWLNAINMLPSLLELSLCSCELEHLPSSLTSLNFTSLNVLDLSYNLFNTSIPQWLFSLTSLTKLDLSFSNLGGKFLDSFGRIGSLKYLYLGGNHFYGSIPASIGNLSSLKELDLSYNEMNGTILESFGQLSNLVKLYLLENSWEGVITEAQLMNLKRLEEFMLTTDKNQSLVFNVTYNWFPPFSLKSLHLESCLIGPKFPFWLQDQSELTHVTLKNVGIVGTIPEEWFSTISSQLTHLDLSNNQIKGNLLYQLVFPNLTKLFLQSNLFSSPIPSNISDLMPSLQYLDLSENHFYGELPYHWNESQIGLRVVDISYNNLCGKIPSSIGFLGNLSILVLSNNNLSGEIPSSLQNCSIVSMDFGGNRLSGNLPSWIESNIFILRLRSNLFSGTIPRKWCNLHKLRILDLAQNNIFGGIPNCFNNFTAMVDHNIFGYKPIENYTEKAYIVTKGREYEYDRTLQFVTCIDLSGNSLTGRIPIQITSLTRLGTLNLSANHLIGSIPKNIGNMRWLETLDLSNNSLFGPIPGSMASLTSLVHLNLSFNNLTGRIPSGNQLQTLNDATMYKGNPFLCGSPLPTKCPRDETSDGPIITDVDDKQDGDDYERIWFYASIGLGFAVGFWTVCGTILLKKSWRHCYFRFCDHIKDRIVLLIH